MMDEDAIDTVALQAQIDLSMSFAQNLVSSWIQPHKVLRNSHQKDLEKELSEYMQRPARLGVGASIPEGYNSGTRETARLKGKLAGTKHSREDEDAIAPQQTSDTEGESRAVAIKKRPKHDPFDVVHGKKKKKGTNIDREEENPQPTTTNSNVTQVQVTISPEEPVKQCLDEPEPNSLALSISKKKKKRKKLKVENGAYDVDGCEVGGSSALLFNGSSNLPSTTLRSPNSVDPPCKIQGTSDVSATSTPTSNIQTQHKFIPLDFLRRPLLNLKLHNDRDSDHEGVPSSSPKKKRKRKRKKKNGLIPSAADTKIDETGNMSSSLK